MSFANFDITDISNVVVTFTNNKITKDSFNEFLNNWNACDLRRENYSFYFDTRNGLGNAQIKYAFGIVGFIKKKKKEPEKFLQYSLINVSSPRNLLLLRFIFSLSNPIAPVYIFQNNSDTFINELREKIVETNNSLSKDYKRDKKIFCYMP